MAKQQQQQPLTILALGDSLTAGYYNRGRAYHPYATHLTRLFESANIPVKIDQRGVSGELVLSTMVNRLHRILEKDPSYDWIIILGGTNDLAGTISAENLFKDGLEAMYEMCLNHTSKKMKLAVMTVIENSFFSPAHDNDKTRQTLNTMIRDYVAKTNEQDRICLVDLDREISYHNTSDNKEQQQKHMWDDVIHLKPVGYDRIATLVFDAIKNKL